MSRSGGVIDEILTPSTNAPSGVTRQLLSLPYWLPLSFHQSGVYTPRLSPKSPGLVQTPTSRALIAIVMSEGQSADVPGTSDDSSSENSSAVTALPIRRALFGN